MRISVLGPLEATDDSGGPIPLQATKQRALLGVLVCYRNAPVSIERILDVLWPDAGPPPSARSNVHLYVHRLRARIGEERIVRTTSGYQLTVRPGEADDEQFEELVEEGRRAAESGDPATASKTFGRALGLWRDTAYADLHHVGPLSVEATRLDELRLNALEGRIDADLELGRHGHLTSELTRLVTEHPMRERLRWQLMLALYRSGRASDALEVYRTGRELLVSEIGMDPGLELRQLHEAILNEDPSLAPPVEQAPPHPSVPSQRRPTQSAAHVPAELPRADSAFTGREKLLTDLRGVIADGGAVVAINGPGGIGKSALAQHLAHSVISSFPGGQLYVNLFGSTPGVKPTEPQNALGRLLRSLGYDDRQIPTEADEAAALFRTATASKRLLILLDNAASVAQVRPLLPSNGGSAVIITSRSVLSTLDGAHHVRLNVLSPDESVDLLAQLAGAERTLSAPDAAAELARHCGYLPLAIRIAGARLVAEPSWDLDAAAEWLADASSRLDELEQDDLAFRATSDVSYHRLAPQTARLFDLLGLLDLPDISAPAAAALAGLPSSQVARQLDDLVDAQLVDVASGRYTMHDLVRLYAREQAQAHFGSAERDDAIGRVVHHYVATARRATVLRQSGSSGLRVSIGAVDSELRDRGVPLADGDAAATWARNEIINLPSVARHAISVDPAAAVALVAALLHPLSNQGRWSELVVLNQIVLSHLESTDRSDWQAMVLRDLGASYTHRGNLDQATIFLERALNATRSLGDRHAEGLVLDELGHLALRRGRFKDSLRYHRAELEIDRELGNASSAVSTLNNLAVAYLKFGHTSEAIECLTEALAMDDPAISDGDRAAACTTLGETLLDVGRPAEAADWLQQAVELFTSVGHAVGAGFALWELGDALNALGRPREAAEHWRLSLQGLRDMGVLTDNDYDAAQASNRRPAVIAR